MVPTLTISKATRALQRSSIPAIRKLLVDETELTLVLEGTVPSYYLKQLAQETVMPHLNGRALMNRVIVSCN